MELYHLTDIHLVDVIAAEDADVIRGAQLHKTQVLIDSIGGTVVPTFAHPHLGRDGVDKPPRDTGQVPPLFHVQIEGLGFELGQYIDTQEVRVDEVVEHKIDQPITATEGHGRLASGDGQGLQPCAFAPC